KRAAVERSIAQNRADSVDADAKASRIRLLAEIPRLGGEVAAPSPQNIAADPLLEALNDAASVARLETESAVAASPGEPSDPTEAWQRNWSVEAADPALLETEAPLDPDLPVTRAVHRSTAESSTPAAHFPVASPAPGFPPAPGNSVEVNGMQISSEAPAANIRIDRAEASRFGEPTNRTPTVHGHPTPTSPASPRQWRVDPAQSQGFQRSVAAIEAIPGRTERSFSERLFDMHTAVAPHAGVIVTVALLLSAGLLGWVALGAAGIEDSTHQVTRRQDAWDGESRITPSELTPHEPAERLARSSAPLTSGDFSLNTSAHETTAASANLPARSIPRTSLPEPEPVRPSRPLARAGSHDEAGVVPPQMPSAEEVRPLGMLSFPPGPLMPETGQSTSQYATPQGETDQNHASVAPTALAEGSPKTAETSPASPYPSTPYRYSLWDLARQPNQTTPSTRN
ncbi:MAG: hypothetical protein KDA61_16780, partial [Planctomycetales bacterium]|nr:hypothetical protein [Planctomycetales bacterium]